MLRGLVFGLLCVLGCSKGSGATEVSGPAGVVVELSGDVQATRGDQTRALAVDGEVYADDTIKTGPASSVAIKLSHNNAALRLDAEMTKRVDKSLAWKAPKQEDDSVLEGREVDDQTAAAGRHTEHEAAATASTAKANEAPAAAAETAPSEAAPAPAPSKPRREPKKVVRRAKKRIAPPPAPKRDKAREIKEFSESAPLDVGSSSGGGPGRGGGARVGASSAPSTRGGPIDVKARLAGKIKVCHALSDDAAAGTITVVVTVSATGAVSIKKLTPSAKALSGVAACARKKISRLKLAGARAGSYTVTVRLE